MSNLSLAKPEITGGSLDPAFFQSPLGLYVHVPFCASTCDFCAFYQTTPTRAGVTRYLEQMRREAALVTWRRRPDTIFWGGGTPGLLAPEDLNTLGSLMLEIGGGHPPAEWTVELAPASVTEARLSALRELGVTRVSMGVQSFSPPLLEALGRQHTREQIFRAYDRLRAAGFPSVNLDLMFALPGQDEAALVADLREAIALAPDHLSTYCLTFEEDTKLWLKLSQGRVKLDPAHEARLYERAWDELAAAGYEQYEVSNFARAGHSCLHNLNTWKMHEWIGLGPSAAGQHAGLRGANPSDLELWGAQLDAGRRMTEDRVNLSPALLAEDALVFGLRLNAGVQPSALQTRFPGLLGWPTIDATFARLIDAGLLELAPPPATAAPAPPPAPTYRLTRAGRLLADGVGAELMGALSEA
jgi:oxygen-independent coproporphyrinogen-3 oxidase